MLERHYDITILERKPREWKLLCVPRVPHCPPAPPPCTVPVLRNEHPQETPPLTAPQKEAVALLGEGTEGKYDLWTLTGDRNAARRQRLMELVTGKKTPKSKAGVNALE